MAFTYTDLTTLIDDCDTDNWTGNPAAGLDNDFNYEGNGCIGCDVDIETLVLKSADFTATDMSGQTIMCVMNCFTALTLDLKTNGGMGIGVEDSTGAQDIWYVGGSDTYQGGWRGFATTLDPGGNNPPDVDGGCNYTDVTNVIVRWKCVAKSKLTQNCFWDFFRRVNDNSPAFRISGTNTTTDLGWSEVADLDETNTAALFQRTAGGYEVLAPFALGDSAGTATTAFTEAQSEFLIWKDLPVFQHYGIFIQGNATGTTDVTIGNVVGSGDDRQGVLGGTITTAAAEWNWDSSTDIADLDSVNLYGVSMVGANEGIALDDGNKTTVISCQFVNCGAVQTGATNNGAEILNTFFIDPDGTTNNYALQFDQTPSGGTMSTNVKQCNFITSGTPTTQYMVHFPESSDYTVGFTDMQVFGTFTSGTLWHGRNTGTDADVTINATGSTNFAQAEFESTDVTGPDTGSVTVNVSVGVNVTIVDSTGTGIQDVQTSVYLSSNDTEVLNVDTSASGLASGTFSGTTPADVYIRWRKSSTGTTRYVSDSSTGSIASGTGLTAQFVMRQDDIVEP
jgi:hypothetical protein